jgi:hypothetical protein
VHLGRRERCSWVEMFECWQSYAERNPKRKNQVPLEFSKLSSWVHEQRKKYGKGILSDDRYEPLHEAGFEFQPRKAHAKHIAALRQKLNRKNGSQNKVEMEALEGQDDSEEAEEGSDDEEDVVGVDSHDEDDEGIVIVMLRINQRVLRTLVREIQMVAVTLIS